MVAPVIGTPLSVHAYEAPAGVLVAVTKVVTPGITSVGLADKVTVGNGFTIKVVNEADVTEPHGDAVATTRYR